jgi:hypothetical protein
LKQQNCDDDPQQRLLEFLEWEEPDEEKFAQEVRIVLASAQFSKELKTAVIWLNDHGLDIRRVQATLGNPRWTDHPAASIV